MTATCSSPDSILEAADSILANAPKLNTFVNGEATESVQLGSGAATPTLRHFMADAQSIVALAANDAAQTVLDTIVEHGAAISDNADAISNNAAAIANNAANIATCVRSFATQVTTENYMELGISDIDDLSDNQIYTFKSYLNAIANNPPCAEGYVLASMSSFSQSTTKGGQVQIAVSKSGQMFVRMLWGNPAAWTAWKKMAAGEEMSANLALCLRSFGKIASAEGAEDAGISDLNAMPPNSIYLFSYFVDSIANQPFDGNAYTVATISPTGALEGGTFQIAVSRRGRTKWRMGWGKPLDEWSAWEETATLDVAGKLFAQDIVAHYSAAGYIHYQTGVLGTYNSSAYRATDYIPVIPGERIEAIRCARTANNCGIAFYDSQKDFISGIQYQAADETGFSPPITVAVPAGACFVRLTIFESCVEDCSFRIYGPQRLDAVNQLAFRTVPSVPMLRNVPESLIGCFLTVGCIGDSITSGACYYTPSAAVRMTQYSWPSVLARITGNTYYNWAIGGIRTDTWLASEMAAECYDGEHLCTGYIIALGINDYNLMHKQGYDPATFIGTSADIDTEDYNNNADTFCGRYGKIIQKIQELQPKAKIFCCTSYRDAQETSGINDAIRSIPAVLPNTYLVDLRAHFDKAFNSGIINQMARTGHFNAVGYHEIALLISSYVDWIIRSNPAEFREIEFIGTEYSYSG